VSRRVGFTLIEMLIVVVIFGLLVLMAYPRASRGLVKSNVRSARTTLANLFPKARAAAMQRGRSASVDFNGNNVVVTASPRTVVGPGTVDTLGGVQNLSSLYGVTVSISPSVASVAYDARGFAGGLGASPVTIWVTRSGNQDSVVLDGLGRVRK
jgi:prepilin-type N-terminal cleavage/methylation domain-containing protein